ncbi:hypothetical protein MNBD_BACTEROID03-1049 [hydrothermal vent metagenome]|uniref:Uncharacterized protein n=1 Tax=hydrothermal vent metagenome TaxID=652676 RepID=A0A3B0SXR2_9ZZZZ
MESSGNPLGTKITNDLTALCSLWNSYGHYKKTCLATLPAVGMVVHSFCFLKEMNYQRFPYVIMIVIPDPKRSSSKKSIKK